MKARLVEYQKFERGVHPKQALGIGGISLGMERHRMRKKMEEDWKFFLLTILDGKTISAVMNKVRDKGQDKGINENGWGYYTVKVDEWEVEEGPNPIAVFISTSNDSRYVLPIDDKKIYIENAR